MITLDSFSIIHGSNDDFKTITFKDSHDNDIDFTFVEGREPYMELSGPTDISDVEAALKIIKTRKVTIDL